MSAPTKPLDPYTLRYLARQMREEAGRVWYLPHAFDRGANGRLIRWARECERLARAEKRSVDAERERGRLLGERIDRKLAAKRASEVETPCVLCGGESTDSGWEDRVGDPVCDRCGLARAEKRRRESEGP